MGPLPISPAQANVQPIEDDYINVICSEKDEMGVVKVSDSYKISTETVAMPDLVQSVNN